MSKEKSIIRRESEEALTIHSTRRRDHLYGLAFCHNEDQVNIKVRFPQLEGDIEWFYVNVEGKESGKQIIGDMFSLETLEEAAQLVPDGYDYIVMPGCPTSQFTTKLRYYALTAPFIAAAGLLKSGGKIISNNLGEFATRYLDDELWALSVVKDYPVTLEKHKSKYRQIGERVMLAEGMSLRNIDTLKGSAFHETVSLIEQERVQRLLEDKIFLTEVLDEFCTHIAEFAGYSHFTRERKFVDSRTRTHIAFIKE